MHRFVEPHVRLHQKAQKHETVHMSCSCMHKQVQQVGQVPSACDVRACALAAFSDHRCRSTRWLGQTFSICSKLMSPAPTSFPPYKKEREYTCKCQPAAQQLGSLAWLMSSCKLFLFNTGGHWIPGQQFIIFMQASLVHATSSSYMNTMAQIQASVLDWRLSLNELKPEQHTDTSIIWEG